MHGIEEDDLFGRASELAFNFLMALFPLLLFMLSLFGLFASRSVQLQGTLLSYFANLLPPAAFVLVSKSTAELLRNASGGKLTFGIALTLWFGSGGMSSMMSTLNAAYRVRESRSWVTIRLIALGLTTAISVLLLVALVVVLVGGALVDWIGMNRHLTSLVVVFWKGVQWVAAVLSVIVSFSMIDHWGPSRGKRRWYWFTPGSVFGALLWLAASLGFRVYLHFFDSYTATYGSLGAVMMLLVWLYVTALAFLIGGKINAEMEFMVTRK